MCEPTPDQGTRIAVTYGVLTFEVEFATTINPELVDHTLTRIRHQMVAAARSLNMVEIDAVAGEAE